MNKPTLIPEQRALLEGAIIHADAGSNLLDNCIRGLNESTPELLEIISNGFRQAALLVDQARGIRYEATDGEGSAND